MAHKSLTRRFDQRLREVHNLPLEQYDVLYQLTEAGGSLTMGDLAGVLLLPPSNCTRLIERMRQRGLVERSVDEIDRRVIHAAITAEGRRLQRRAGATHLEDIQTDFGVHIDEETAKAMAAVLQSVVAEPAEESTADD